MFSLCAFIYLLNKHLTRSFKMVLPSNYQTPIHCLIYVSLQKTQKEKTYFNHLRGRLDPWFKLAE